MRRCLLLITIVFGLLLVAPLRAQTPKDEGAAQPADAKDETFRRNLERWRNMTPEEKQKLRERFERWKNMSEDERQRVRENLERFKRMREEKRQQMQRIRSIMGQLEPQEVEKIREHLGELRRMPEERRRERMKPVLSARALLQEDIEGIRRFELGSPEAHRALRQLRMRGAVLRRIGPEAVERLMKLSPEERRQAIEHLMRENPPVMQPPHHGMEPRPDAQPENHGGEHPEHDQRGVMNQPGFRLTPEERTRVMELPPEERMEAIRKITTERLKTNHVPHRPAPRPHPVPETQTPEQQD